MDFPSGDFGTLPIAINIMTTAPPAVKSVEGWALAPSGYRAHFSFWLARGILGADSSTCNAGGVVLRG
jgi:hypothetical protein